MVREYRRRKAFLRLKDIVYLNINDDVGPDGKPQYRIDVSWDGSLDTTAFQPWAITDTKREREEALRDLKKRATSRRQILVEVRNHEMMF